MSELETRLAVVVADADADARTSLDALLRTERDLEVLTPIASEAEVRHAVTADVAVLVQDLGTERGPVAALVSVRRLAARPAWVVLLRDDTEAQEVLDAGAHGCLHVSSSPLQILAAIRAAGRGERPDVEDTAAIAVTGPLVQRSRRDVADLNERELEVLRLVDGDLTNLEIAERLYLSVSSVKSRLSHTYGRLGVNNREAAVAEARRQGYL